ncbi:hypothetical protein LJC34_06970, partial [Oscillospiraceae bacterium OttesenSCG-928-G22]|nr:hypothetical protein [Oscillospiraceae bacterium OttesenSCG-928-G22]
ADKTMYWFGDLGGHVPKYGIPKERIAQAYQAALAALGETHEAFQSDDRYIYRGNMVIDMCRRNDLPIPEYIQRQMPPEELDFNMGGM